MISSASQLRQKGADDLTGRWGEAALFSFVYCLIVGGIGLPFSLFNKFVLPHSGNFLILFVSLPLAWGYTMAFLANHYHKDNDPFSISHFLDGFRDYSRIFTTLLLKLLYTLFWTLLLIVPGIIKSYSYAMTPYILRNHPELKNNEAIEMSMDMMDGHKAKLFWLQLTFIGWYILCFFTLGIGIFWLMPYYSSTMANFYEEVKAEYEGRIGEKPAEVFESGYSKSER